MTDYPSANEAMIQHFADVWSPSGFEYTLGNEKFTPPVGSPWARMVIRHNAATQSTLGQSGNRQFDRFGSVIIQVFTPEQEGTTRASQLIQRITDGFEGARITGTTICFLDTIPREIGVSDEWYQVNVEATFRYTELK